MLLRSPHDDVDIPLVALPDFLLEHAADHADKPALIDGSTGRTITFGALAHLIDRMAAGLAERGVAKGDVVAIYSPNLPEYAVAFFGTARAGGTVTTVNPLYTTDELSRQLTDAGASMLITIPQLLEKAQPAAEAAGVEHLVVFGEAEGTTPFAELVSSEAPAPAVEIDPKEDVVVLPYSSGTTGMPKGVMLTHYNLVANMVQTLAVEQMDEDERVIGILPFYHIYGMVVVMGMTLYRGCTVVTMPRFDLEAFLGLLQEHEITTAFLVPPILLALAKHPLVDQFDLSSLQQVISGAAPLPEAVASGCAQRIGCEVRQGYGMTELSPVSHFIARGSDASVASVGTLIPNTEARIVALGTDDDVEMGELGELWVRGPQVMKGYLNRPAETRSMLDDDGWLHTGDVVRVDEEGRFYIVDRVKELIKYKGLQVAPAELEAVLQGHPGIGDVAVIPSPDEEAGEVPKAFVVLKPGVSLTEDEVMAYVAERVAPFKKVRRVAFVDQIPRVPSGKILRRELVKRERAQPA